MRYCEVCRASFQATAVCPRDGVRARADISDPLLDYVVGGRYRILERIAAGGMGQIYRAAHTRIASLVAVKFLYGDLTHVPEMRARFQREAEAASCLQSRHIVRVLDFGETSEGLLFLAMEHLSGTSFSGVIGRAGKLGQARAVAIAKQVARGLSHAHERGIVHRDLKPDNVMLVTEDDEDDVVKLLDFGIAQIRTSSKLTSAGQFLGTPHYMAPEQFAGLGVDARADLYSLGVMLFEALTGAVPFDATSVVDLARAHMSTPAPKVRERRTDDELDPRLEEIVARLLAKAPDERFATARAVLDALKDVSSAPKPRTSRVSVTPTAAGPAVPREAVEVVWSAIQVGTSLYNSGDHAGCARVYCEAAETILAGKPRPAVAARLRAALGRAKDLQPTQAAWEIRFAFDDLLHGSVVTIVPAPGDAILQTEIAAAQAIASSRYAENDLDAVGAFYLELARTLEAWLREEGREPATADWLARTADRAARAGGGQRGLAELSEALESVRNTRVGTMIAAGSGAGSAASVARPAIAAPLPQAPPARPSLAAADCPRLDEIARRLVAAISAGAPAYNAGDIVGCLRLYRQTAETLVTELAAEPACAGALGRLRAALDKSQNEDADRGAWTMRRTFDELLAAASGK